MALLSLMHTPTRRKGTETAGAQGSRVPAKRDKRVSARSLLLAVLLCWSAASVALAEPRYQSAGVFDFNRDGIPDLLLTDRETGELLVRSSVDTARVKEERTGILLERLRTVVGAADFNRDGYPDLLLLDQSTGTAVILYLKKWNVVSQATVHPPTNADELAGVGDFNRDGSPDLLWSNKTTGNAVAWYMDGVARLASERVSTLLPPWRIVGVGDCNDDGAPDIAYENPSTGETVVCCMRGARRIDEHSIGGRSPPWSIPTIFESDGHWVAGAVWRQIASLSSPARFLSDYFHPFILTSHPSIRAPPIA